MIRTRDQRQFLEEVEFELGLEGCILFWQGALMGEGIEREGDMERERGWGMDGWMEGEGKEGEREREREGEGRNHGERIGFNVC